LTANLVEIDNNEIAFAPAPIPAAVTVLMLWVIPMATASLDAMQPSYPTV